MFRYVGTLSCGGVHLAWYGSRHSGALGLAPPRASLPYALACRFAVVCDNDYLCLLILTDTLGGVEVAMVMKRA